MRSFCFREGAPISTGMIKDYQTDTTRARYCVIRIVVRIHSPSVKYLFVKSVCVCSGESFLPPSLQRDRAIKGPLLVEKWRETWYATRQIFVRDTASVTRG